MHSLGIFDLGRVFCCSGFLIQKGLFKIPLHKPANIFFPKELTVSFPDVNCIISGCSCILFRQSLLLTVQAQVTLTTEMT
jgi:hypothetical protein